MAYSSNFKVNLIVRVLLIFCTCIILVDLFYSGSYTLTKVLVSGLLAYEIYVLIKYLDKTNRELAGFLDSIKYDDFTHTYTTKKTGTSMDDLYLQFNQVIKKFREIRAEKEAQHQYLRTIVQHVGIGIITFDKTGEIQIINATAKSLLGIDLIKNVKQLKNVSHELVNSLLELKTGGRDLLKIEKKGEEIQLAIYAIELMRRDEEFKLISIQNIKSELEEKEMDAWQNLIRVLTHEIMNSVTPISSLAATIESELESQINREDFKVENISKEDLADFHMALHTIHKRSEGLIKFVSDFRNLTRIPIPQLEDVLICDLIRPILSLLRFDIEQNDIKINLNVEPEQLIIRVDKEQVEQVLINLLKNAIQAMGENEEMNKLKEITICAAIASDDRVVVKIADNGTGIDEEALKKVFIPFFTTKKTGSGIGLSLSKQIMRKHNGNISVHSVVNEGTEFMLSFPR
ncbi:ATP-binding protein [Reichenbachiella carrageenanivorans]|uniref:histidine kinase n=1 Tax=Reichenbachiella carrageenanivorans TaxID=2979869 RepID=A0ABY6D0C0_9BACT|nr:ATP-binding protein [Reichenbachiella carrageenanivorans]UXX79622.1 ATP-binding protein [Reichenbachiella carrageenanivorans]